MFDAPVRRLMPRLFGAPVRWIVRAGISPNLLSWVGLALALAAALAVASSHDWIGLVLWLVSRLVDALDGMVARAGGGSSSYGGYLDITLDMAAYGVMVLAFAMVHPDQWLMMLSVMFGYLLVTTTTLALSSILEREAQQRPGNDRTLQFTPGFAEAGETSLVYVAWTALPTWITLSGWIWVGLCFATVVQRTLLARRLLMKPSH
jgi:phosphatidylglycerophosphate synthase